MRARINRKPMRTPEECQPRSFVRFQSDFELARLALSGDAAASGEIALKIVPQVKEFLLSRALDQQSIEKVQEIVSDLPSDCLAPPLLELYQGSAPLKQWFRIVGHSRLKSFWRSPEYRRKEPNAKESEPIGSAIVEDPDVAVLLRVALENTFARIEPSRVVYLRLVFLHGITRECLARMLGTRASTIGREINTAAYDVERIALIFIRRLDPCLTIEWEDCLEICRKYPRLLHGDPVE